MKIGIVPNPCYMDPAIYISKCREYADIDIWKILMNWNSIEPSRSNFSTTYIDKIKQVLIAAANDGVKVQLSFNQAYWPSWTGCSSNSCGGTYPRFTNPTINNYLKDAWIYIVNQLKNYSALDSYLIVNEDAALQSKTISINIDNYINVNNTIVTVIRQADPNINHKIVTRSLCSGAANYTYLRYKISTRGYQDTDYGITNYAVGSASCNHNESPTSVTSCFMTDVNLREPYKYSGKPTNLGEIGYYKGVTDTWGDAERLKGFKRAMAIAYELGCNEFMIWSCGADIEKGGGFRYPTTYFPQLKQFRDLLVTKPKPTKYNVRILLDNTSWLNLEWYPQCNSPTISLSDQPYFHLMQRLDEVGASWFWIHNSTAQYITTNYPYDVTIKTSEIYGKSIATQDNLINSRLTGLTLTGNYYPWSGTDAGDVILRLEGCNIPISSLKIF